MSKAIWNDVIIAESDKCETVEGNLYFPPDAILPQYFQESEHHTICSWKGTAHYYHINVNGKVNNDAAWFYPEPKAAANNIRGYVAFWKGVTIVK